MDASHHHELRIEDFSQENRPYFKALNYAWIEKYFEIEPLDREVLENPESAILAKGGAIYFARFRDEIVGACALTPVGEQVIELGKMAVREDCQGLGIGKLLLQHCINKARGAEYREMVLYSNTALVKAINMYINAGFRLTEKNDFHSKRSNIKMKRALTQFPLNNKVSTGYEKSDWK